MKKQERGITLIALVITIIVLLILAGISIATITGENGILTKASTAKDETKKVQYKEILELIGIELRPKQILENLNTKDFMDLYEEKIQEEIEKGDLLEGATKQRKDERIIWVTTKEGWIYQITEEEVSLLGNRTENPEPPTLQEAGITFDYNPNDWTKENVKVTITTTAEKFSLQYTLKDPQDESSWNHYPSTGVDMSENGEIYARLKNNLGETSQWATGEVSKIDRKGPEVNLNLGAITSNSIVVNVLASDTRKWHANS